MSKSMDRSLRRLIAALRTIPASKTVYLNVQIVPFEMQFDIPYVRRTKITIHWTGRINALSFFKKRDTCSISWIKVVGMF
ncbi:hypothetical protein FRB91_008212 [Serendipita sp. 411]|nr:hypothetical protein FRC15_002359 [Serendipita sp. 397]KAG8800852.1 hypothetical protein FRC16_001921 [Serendipita sp. 398]KAG8861346.1 hypothetical protein FRB91_008212 [Serendipita sp. 411]